MSTKTTVWVKLISPASAQLKLTAQVNATTPYYVSLATQTVSAGGDWVKLEGTYRYLHDDVTLYVESP
ncbi:carbohydrate binding domain-containing protein [Paenibacillus rhizoplanae]